jgi:autotransporter-associated beta strand protein
MKTPIIKTITSICLLLAAGTLAVRADTLSWDPTFSYGSGGTGTWDFNTTANWYSYNTGNDFKWTDNLVPGTNTALFSGTAGTVTLNAGLSVSNLQYSVAGYTLAGTGPLTLGGGGIDASAASGGTTTIGTPLTLVGGQQLWQVGSGGTLAINGVVTRSAGTTVDFSSAGITCTNLTNDASGILGGWATVGAASGTGGDWAANDGSGNIITYAGYTAVSGTVGTGGGATLNWNNTGGTVTLTANTVINSLVQANDVTVNSGVTLTLNSGGLLLRGISRWMLGGSTTTSFLTSGSSTGELFVHIPDSDANANNWTLWPIIKDNGATPVKLIKDGAGYLKMGNDNTYTGGTMLNAGTLAACDGAEYGQGLGTTGIRTPFGTGNVTVNGGQLQLGCNVGNSSAEYDITNTVTLNGGALYAIDAYHHLKGSLAIGASGGAMGSSFDAVSGGFAKGLFIDGVLTGTGNLTVQDSGFETVNTWDRSLVYFTSPGTAAQNTYSGTVTVNSWANQGGSYLFLIGTNALANATINVNGDNTTGNFGPSALLFGSGTNLDGFGFATIGGLSGTGDFVLANTLRSRATTAIPWARLSPSRWAKIMPARTTTA